MTVFDSTELINKPNTHAFISKITVLSTSSVKSVIISLKYYYLELQTSGDGQYGG